MPRPHQAAFDYSLRIGAPPARVLAAFFDARALAEWWDVSNVIATPRPLGVYALEWKTSASSDPLLGRFGGVLHGTIIDYRAGRGFLVADCHWLPPDSDPVGPMALEVEVSKVEGPRRDRVPSSELHVVQRGVDEDSPRWLHYYELLASGWPPAFDRLKAYLETGRGVWDLRGYE